MLQEVKWQGIVVICITLYNNYLRIESYSLRLLYLAAEENHSTYTALIIHLTHEFQNEKETEISLSNFIMNCTLLFSE